MTLLERRLRSEWDLLRRLAALNPGRLSALHADDTRFYLVLHGPAAAAVDLPVPVNPATPLDEITPENKAAPEPVIDHALRIQFPVHFPAVPMEGYLQRPVVHPNIHPLTGFVCLWDRHRVSNTVEHALHKLVDMLCGRLFNADPVHVMQPEALAMFAWSGEAMGARPPCEGLTGLVHDTFAAERLPDTKAAPASTRRSRLS